MASAMRRSRPCTRRASASRNEPRNRKITGSPKGANPSARRGAPRATASAGPSTAVIGSGMRLPHPEDHHQRHHRGQALRGRLERHRGQQHGQEGDRAEPDRDAAPDRVDPGLRGRRDVAHAGRILVAGAADRPRYDAPMECPRCGAPDVATPACPAAGCSWPRPVRAPSGRQRALRAGPAAGGRRRRRRREREPQGLGGGGRGGRAARPGRLRPQGRPRATRGGAGGRAGRRGEGGPARGRRPPAAGSRRRVARSRRRPSG